MNEPLLILGASARAAAQSACRTGFFTNAIDLFTDVDLVACCQRTARIEDYPLGFLNLVSEMPAGPWMYTGALENYPELIEQLALHRPLLGNDGPTLRLVRDPLALGNALRDSGHAAPECEISPTVIPRDGTWLRKALRSAGGMRIERWDPSTCEDSDTTKIWQKHIPGVPCGGLFIAAHDRAVLLGVTRSLHGPAWGAPRPFQYAGSIGPLPLADDRRQEWQAIGNTLAQWSNLRGLFGVDAIVNDDGIFTLEVNPRLTASMELVERAGQVSAVAWHVRTCVEQILSDCNLTAGTLSPELHGKLIVFAPRDLVISETFAKYAREQNAESLWPTIADIPPPGLKIACGQPLATLFANGADVSEVERNLRAAAEEILSIF